MLFNPSDVPLPRPVAGRPRGFGLLQVLLLIAVMAGLATMGYLQWRERAAVDASRQERMALAQADRALLAFATVERRLPCPDTNRDGVEDCAVALDQKGWLPSVTLRLAGADPGVDVGQLRYLVQRGTGGNNLTQLTDAWTPLIYDDAAAAFSAMRSAPYPAGILTLPDLCQRLETARTTALGATQARVNASPLRPVAYALAHPGGNDADGDGDLFDGANSNAAANADLMEDPARRPLLATYNDLVLERSPASLQADLHCRPLADAINTVALGHDVVVQVAEMRTDNIEAAIRAVAFSALAAVMTGLEIVLTIAEGISDAGNAALEWVACAASLGLAVNACAAAPQHTVAIGLAGGVVGANIAAVALNATAAGIAGTALLLASNTVTLVDACPPMDTTLISQMLTNAQAELASATNARIAAQTEVTNKTIERDAAIDARTTAVGALRSTIRGTGASSQIDGLVDPLLTSAGNWATTSYDLAKADVTLSQATEERDNWAAEVAKYDSIRADSAAAIVRLNGEIAVLDAQIAAAPSGTQAEIDALNILKGKRSSKLAEIQMAESVPQLDRLNNEIAALEAQIATDPPNKAELQAQLAKKVAERRSNLYANARSKADASLAAAQTALTNAAAARTLAASGFNTAQTSYQTAYSNLVNGASRYAIYDASGNVTRYGCTTACQAGDLDVSSSLHSLLGGLFGGDRSIRPDLDAIYLKPVKLQKELDALNSKLSAAQTRETNARNQRDQIQLMVNNPAPCNASGTAVIPMTPGQAEGILVTVDRKGGTR